MTLNEMSLLVKDAQLIDAWGTIYELQYRNDDVKFYRDRLYMILLMTNRITYGHLEKTTIHDIRQQAIKGLLGPKPR